MVGPAPTHELPERYLAFKGRIDAWRERYEACVADRSAP